METLVGGVAEMMEIPKVESVVAGVPVSVGVEVMNKNATIFAKDMKEGKYYRTVQGTKYEGYIKCEMNAKDLDGGDILKVENLITQNTIKLPANYKLIEISKEEAIASAKARREYMRMGRHSQNTSKNKEVLND